ncbi:MAG TPA: Derepression protein [Scandinavium sp.]|jgi:hypothetical protein|uniref:Derepression protein n=1 Tax=Scandinavium sp. TaxID=2830653 RepID=UPI002E3591AD|nr:Derepression protein [Scandinavium sp.]HEX4502968.1 Derepression protein [Scandinavium sp.]
MHSEHLTQTLSTCRDAALQAHLSIEAYQKLNRASAVSQFVGGDLLRREINGLQQLWLPQIFSYLHEDISYVLEELKDKGLCRDFLATQEVEHV